MYNQNDFLKIFNYLKDHPDQKDVSQTIVNQNNIDGIETNMSLVRENEEIDRRIEVAYSYQYMLSEGIYSIVTIKNFISQVSNELYERIKDLNTEQEIIDEINNYILYLESLKHNITWGPEEKVQDDTTQSDITTDIDLNIVNLAIETRNETKTLFKNVIDQIAFNTNDYNKLRRFIIDWYSSIRVFLKLQSVTTDAFSMTNQLLEIALQSFGFRQPDLVNQKYIKAGLLLALVDIYKKKGSPDSIVEILNFLGISDVSIYEWWLYRERLGNSQSGDLYIVGKKTHTDGNFDVEETLKTHRFLSYNEFKRMFDNHWYYTEDKIKEIDDRIEHLSLPSIMPYFSISIYMDYTRVNDFSHFLNKMCNDIFVEYIQEDISDDKLIYINELNQKVSVLELYLGILYSYNKYNDYVKYSELENFIIDKYGLHPTNYGSTPFTETYPYKYEKLIHWCTYNRDLDSNIISLNEFNLYPTDIEHYPIYNLIANSSLSNIDYDNSKPTYHDYNYFPFIINTENTSHLRRLHYNNLPENIYDPYDKEDIAKIITEELDPLIKRFVSTHDTIIIYISKSKLPLNGYHYKIGDEALIIRDESHTDKYTPQIYKCISLTGTIDEQWELINDENSEEWIALQNKLLRKKYDLGWTAPFITNYSRNRIDAQRILSGNSLPTNIEFKYNLPLTGNTIGNVLLVRKDETQGYLPTVYNCISTTGSINDQWEYDPHGLYKLEMGLNNALIPSIDNYCSSNEEIYFNLVDILLTYLYVFFKTYVLEDAININELLIGSSRRVKPILNDFKPKRARILTYETIFGQNNPVDDSINLVERLNTKPIQYVEHDRRETIRDRDRVNYDSTNEYHVSISGSPNHHDPEYVHDEFSLSLLAYLHMVTNNDGSTPFDPSIVKTGLPVSWDLDDGNFINNTNSISYSGYIDSSIKNVQFSQIDNYNLITEVDARNDNILQIKNMHLLFPIIEKLYLQNNSLNEIEKINTLTTLTHLYLNNNLFTNILRTDKLINLEELNLSNNQILLIGKVNNFSNITLLNLSNNQLTNIGEVTYLYNLISLILHTNTNLSDIGSIGWLNNLIYFDIHDTNISGISNLYLLTNLIQFHINNCQFTNEYLSDIISQLWIIRNALGANSCDIKTENNNNIDANNIHKIEGYSIYENHNLKTSGCTLSYDYTPQFSLTTNSTNPNTFSIGVMGSTNNIWLLETGIQNGKNSIAYNFSTGGTKTPQLYTQDVKEIIGLTANNSNITNIDDITLFFENIEILELHNNSLTDIPIETLFKLKRINIRNNSLTDIDLTQHRQLEYLDLSDNNLININIVAQNSNLKELYTQNNSLTHIGIFEHYDNIVNIDISNNSLTDIGYIEDLYELLFFKANDNLFTSIGTMEDMNNLKLVYFQNNQLEDFGQLTNNDELRYLDLRNNNFPADPILAPLNIDYNNTLSRHVVNALWNNRINLGANICVIDIRNNSQLEQFAIDQIEGNGIYNLDGLKDAGCLVYYDGGPVPQTIIMLKTSCGPGDTFDPSITKPTGPAIDWDLGDGTIINTQNSISYSGYIDGSEKFVKLYTIDDYANITHFIADNDKLHEARFINLLTNLTNLDLHNNYLEIIEDMNELINLTFIDLSYNNLKTIGRIDDLINIIQLNISHNDLQCIGNITDLKNITSLNLNNNQLTNIGSITNLTNLISLEINNNVLTNIGSFDLLINLSSILLNDNDFSKEYMSNIISEMWSNRILLGANSCNINIINNNCITYQAYCQIEGIGLFESDGLKDHGCTVTYDCFDYPLTYMTIKSTSSTPEDFEGDINNDPLTPFIHEWDPDDGSPLVHINDFTKTYPDSTIKNIKLLSNGYEYIHELILTNDDISEINNLDILVNLHELNIQNNDFAGPIIPEISNLTSLNYLNISRNQFNGSIPLFNNLINLQYFYGNNNQFVNSIPILSGLPNLKIYYCNNNQIDGSIPQLITLNNLENYHCNDNQITGSIPTLSGLINLIWFDCSINQINGSMPSLNGLNNLERFHCNNNQIDGSLLSLKGLIKLSHLYCQYNQISGYIDGLNECTDLTRLYLHNNNFTTISLSNIINDSWLIRSNLGSNSCIIKIENNNCINFYTCLQIEGSGTLTGDGLKDYGCTVTYDCVNLPNQYLTIKTTSDNLTTFDPIITASYTHVWDLDDSNPWIHNNSINKTYPDATEKTVKLMSDDYSNITSLDCNNDDISEITNINLLTNLTYLNYNTNSLPTLDISSLINLLYLNCGNNSIVSLDTSLLTNIITLICNNNSIPTINVSALINLIYFDCRYNGMTTTAVNDMIDDFWINRIILGANSCYINISHNSYVDLDAYQKIEGLGPYIGDGLKDHGCTVIYDYTTSPTAYHWEDDTAMRWENNDLMETE